MANTKQQQKKEDRREGVLVIEEIGKRRCFQCYRDTPITGARFQPFYSFFSISILFSSSLLSGRPILAKNAHRQLYFRLWCNLADGKEYRGFATNNFNARSRDQKRICATFKGELIERVWGMVGNDSRAKNLLEWRPTLAISTSRMSIAWENSGSLHENSRSHSFAKGRLGLSLTMREWASITCFEYLIDS